MRSVGAPDLRRRQLEIGLSADDYPELPEVDDEFSVDIRQGTLKAMINQTSFAVSTNETRPGTHRLKFEKGEQV